MPPKPANLPASKLALVLNHFHTNQTAHALKDLEKSLPQAAGINPMHVKDYLQSLTDEGLVRVEKIGSGNWYWSFPGDEKKCRVIKLKELRKERDGAVRIVEGLRQEERKLLTVGDDDDNERGTLVKELEGLRKEKARLSGEIELLGEAGEVVRRAKELTRLKDGINKVTDDLYVLINYVKQLCGNDKETMTSIWNQFLGGAPGNEEGELEYV